MGTVDPCAGTPYSTRLYTDANSDTHANLTPDADADANSYTNSYTIADVIHQRRLRLPPRPRFSKTISTTTRWTAEWLANSLFSGFTDASVPSKDCAAITDRSPVTPANRDRVTTASAR